MMSEPWWKRWYPLGIALVGGAIFAPTLRFGVVNRDDPWLIRDNVLLQEASLDALSAEWIDLTWEQRFRLGAEYLPVRDMSVMLDFVLFGDWIGGHHLAQVIYYAITCAFVALFVGRWSGKPALATGVGLLFAIHPLHTEAVAWLSERKGVLGTMFLFASLCAFLRYLTRRRLGWWALTMALLACAVFSKAHMVAGVGVMILLAWQSRSAEMDRSKVIGVTGIAVLGALCFAPAYLTGLQVGMVQPYHDGGFIGTLALFTDIHAHYLKLLAGVGPFGIHYAVGEPSLIPRFLGGITAVAMIVYVGWSLVRRSDRDLTALGFGWWLAFLAPVSHLVFPIQNLIADRYMLVPSFGLILVLCTALIRLSTVFYTGSLVVLGVLSALLTLQQTQTWQTSEAMWQHAVFVDQTYGVAWEKLANEAMDAGNLDEAWQLTETGLTHAPDHWPLMHRQALILRARGDEAGAEAAFRRAANYPDADKAQANLALQLLELGRTAEARRWAETAVRTRDRIAHNLRVLGKIALEQDDLQAASTAFERALTLEPYDANNHYNMGVADLRLGRIKVGIQRFQSARALDPTLAGKVDTALRLIEKHNAKAP